MHNYGRTVIAYSCAHLGSSFWSGPSRSASASYLATEDRTRQPMSLTSCEQRICFAIAILNDLGAEMLASSFKSIIASGNRVDVGARKSMAVYDRLKTLIIRPRYAQVTF